MSKLLHGNDAYSKPNDMWLGPMKHKKTQKKTSKARPYRIRVAY